MAALLVGMAIMALMMTAAMPVWKQTAQREKEDELVFRGMQYVHAIALFQRKTANAYPPSIQVLLDQRFLRKKYKDPITGDDFQLLAPGQSAGGAGTNAQGQRGAQPGQTTPGQTPGGGAPASGQRATAPIGTSPAAGIGGAAAGGITGVASKSKDKSIRIYNGRTHYNEWAFVFTPQLQAPGAGAGGSAAPGQRGGQPQRGQPGQQPVGGPGPLGGQRGGRGTPQGPGGRGPGGFGQPGFPGSVQPLQPVQPTQPGRGRSGG
jgi:type II secretory pathway pseudopilin PulG